jgi:hypothetical protein
LPGRPPARHRLARTWYWIRHHLCLRRRFPARGGHRSRWGALQRSLPRKLARKTAAPPLAVSEELPDGRTRSGGGQQLQCRGGAETALAEEPLRSSGSFLVRRLLGNRSARQGTTPAGHAAARRGTRRDRIYGGPWSPRAPPRLGPPSPSGLPLPVWRENRERSGGD